MSHDLYRRFTNSFSVNEHIVLSVVAVFIGLLVGYGAIFFRTLVGWFQTLFMGDGHEGVVMIVQGLPWWQILLAPTVGGLIVGLLAYHFLTPGESQGVPEVMSAVALHSGKINLRSGMVKMLASALSIGCGASVGREGPVIHLGATLASAVGRKLHMSTRHMRTMVGCGAAAGIAASFNAPIAGVMFSLEVILADYGLATFSPIVLSSVIATVVARMHLGDYPAFIVPHYTLVSAWEIPAYVGLGLLCGLVGIFFMFTLFKTEDLMAKIPIPRYLKPILGGIVMGGIALLFPHVMGVGYDTMNLALLEEVGGLLLFALLFAKIFATAVTLGSGFAGGEFTPVLFLGAMLGGSFGTFIHGMMPELSAGAGAYTLVGMGAMVAAVLGAPLASILILFELTNDYRIMLALMVSSIVATLLVNQVYRDSVYTRVLRRKNINLWSGRESGLLNQISVSAVMQRNCELLVDTMTIRRVREKISKSKEESYLVVDGNGRLKGIVSFQDIRGILSEEGLENLVLVRDITNPSVLTVTPEDNLYHAFRRMGSSNMEQLPVLSAQHSDKVVGMITDHGIMRAYNKALMERETGGDL
ncbi:MAG: chloride channel protein [Magnetococcales bacterium]|nr:chloride channel protein [Magnetococcales bacterium]